MTATIPDTPFNLTKVRIVGTNDGDILGMPGVMHDRIMLSGMEAGGGFALVEQLLPPRMLAAPLHRHTREDEYSYVLEGRVGALLGNVEVFGDAGQLICKPRGQWHTYWNAGDEPLRILEMISPGGFEQAFRELNALGEAATPEAISRISNRYGVEVDFEGTPPIINRHGLEFWA